MLRNHKSIAYALLRSALGLDIFGHGFFRILTGVAAFAHATAPGMDKGPLPHTLTLGFLYAVPWIELSIGLLLILGFYTRVALVLGSLFMLVLLFGITSVQNWTVAGLQLQYCFIFFALLWLLEANAISLDSWMRREKL